MPYLVAARRSQRMGIVPMVTDGAAPRSNLIISRFLPSWPGVPTPMPGPMPVYNPNPTGGGSHGSVSPIIVGPISTGPGIGVPVGAPASNAGTPVPAGYPTSQIFVDANGGFWEFSSTQNQWINVGTPYNTSAAAVPPAAPTGSTPSAPTTLTAPTTAPAPVSVSVATPSSTYTDILNWLQGSDLGTTIGFPSIPNWIIAGAGVALVWKFSRGGGSSRRNPSQRRARRRRR